MTQKDQPAWRTSVVPFLSEMKGGAGTNHPQHARIDEGLEIAPARVREVAQALTVDNGIREYLSPAIFSRLRFEVGLGRNTLSARPPFHI